MNLSVTDSVQVLGVSAPFGFGHQVMGITLARWNFAFAQWTNQVRLDERWPFLLKQSSNSSHGCKLAFVTGDSVCAELDLDHPTEVVWGLPFPQGIPVDCNLEESV